MNQDSIACWNEVLVPKWQRFRHLLSGNGATHSNIAAEYFDIRSGDRVLDVGCGYGETCLDLAARVGATGTVTGLDCTGAFLEIADAERLAAGVPNIEYELGDAQTHALPEAAFDVVYSRFGVMFFQSVVMALRNVREAMKPGARLCLIAWRSIDDNPCWSVARDIALKYLSPPGDDAKSCGPGPFSMADEKTTRAMLAAAGFDDIRLFLRIDTDICVGTDLDEAVAYQLLVGPAGEIVREAGDRGKASLPAVRADLVALLGRHKREDGQVYLGSSTWAIMARRTA